MISYRNCLTHIELRLLVVELRLFQCDFVAFHIRPCLASAVNRDVECDAHRLIEAVAELLSEIVEIIMSCAYAGVCAKRRQVARFCYRDAEHTI